MEDSTSGLRTLKLTDTWGSCPGNALLIWQGKATKPREDVFRERIGKIIKRSLAGEARMKTYKYRIAERRRVRGRRARIERGAGDVPEEPGSKHDEQVAVRRADAPGGTENQHEEKIMRDIRVNKRGSGATSEEQLDEWRKTERLEHEAPNTSASSDPFVAPENHVRDETPSRSGSVLGQKSGHVDEDVQISALDVFNEKDGRRSRYIGEVLERYRGEDAGDLKRSELNELVENWTCLNALEREMWEINPKILMDEKSWKTWKSNQMIVMDEEMVQNIVMDEKFVKNFVMGIYPCLKLVDGKLCNSVTESCWNDFLTKRLYSSFEL